MHRSSSIPSTSASGSRLSSSSARGFWARVRLGCTDPHQRPVPVAGTVKPPGPAVTERVTSGVWERHCRSWVAPDPATSPISREVFHAGIRRRHHVELLHVGFAPLRSENPVITGQQIRAVLGAGGQVVDSDGQHVGRIVDVVLSAETFQPAWVTVACEPGSGAVIVVPLTAARQLEGCVQVPYTADDIRGAPGLNGAAGR